MFRAVDYVSLKNRQSESVLTRTMVIIKMSVDFGGFSTTEEVTSYTEYDSKKNQTIVLLKFNHFDKPLQAKLLHFIVHTWQFFTAIHLF